MGFCRWFAVAVALVVGHWVAGLLDDFGILHPNPPVLAPGSHAHARVNGGDVDVHVAVDAEEQRPTCMLVGSQAAPRSAAAAAAMTEFDPLAGVEDLEAVVVRRGGRGAAESAATAVVLGTTDVRRAWRPLGPSWDEAAAKEARMRRYAAVPRAEQGGFVLYTGAGAAPVRLPVRGFPEGLDFHPHGLSVLPRDEAPETDRAAKMPPPPPGVQVVDDGPPPGRRVFVVNHQRDRDTVEVFETEEDDGSLSPTEGLFHVTTAAHPFLTGINDVVALTPWTFVVSTFASSEAVTPSTMVDMFGRRPNMWLTHCTLGEYTARTRCARVDEGLKGANGVQLSHDGKLLFVAETFGRTFNVYNRTERYARPDVYTLISRTRTPHGLPDNIDVDPVTGKVLLAVHPLGLPFMQHVDDPTVPSPSVVVEVVEPARGFASGDPPVFAPRYIHDGSDFSAVATGVTVRFGGANDTRRLVMGAVFDSGFADCPYWTE